MGVGWVWVQMVIDRMTDEKSVGEQREKLRSFRWTRVYSHVV